MNFFCASRPLGEGERRRKNRQILGSCLRAEKAVGHESVWALGTIPKKLEKKLDELNIKEKTRNYADYSIVEISWNLPEFLETWGYLLSSEEEKTSVRAAGKNTLTGRIENLRKNRDHPDHIIDKIISNTEKSPWDLSRLAVTQILKEVEVRRRLKTIQVIVKNG